MKLAFSGHRDKIANWWQLKQVMEFYGDDQLIVVHGGAEGFDAQVSAVAKRLGIGEEVHRPDWKRYGSPQAAFIRNKAIVDSSHILVVLYDGRTRGGTFQALCYAQEKDKTIYYLNIMKDMKEAKKRGM